MSRGYERKIRRCSYLKGERASKKEKMAISRM